MSPWKYTVVDSLMFSIKLWQDPKFEDMMK